MGQKVNPISLRLRVNRQQDSQWFGDYNYGALLTKDLAFRDSISKVFQIANLAPGRTIIQCLPKKFKAFPFFGESYFPKKQKKYKQKLRVSKAYLRKNLNFLSSNDQNNLGLQNSLFLLNNRLNLSGKKDLPFKGSKKNKISLFLKQNSIIIDDLLKKNKSSVASSLKSICLDNSSQVRLLEKIHNKKTKTQKKKLKSDLEAFQLIVSRLKDSKGQRQKKVTHFITKNGNLNQPNIPLHWAFQSFFHLTTKKKIISINEVIKRIMSNFYLYRDLLPFFEMKLSKWTKIKRTFFLNQSIEHLESVFHNSLGIPTNIMPLKVKNSYKGADFLANKIAKKLEKTRAYRKVLKTSYLETQKNPFVKGIRISISGRLGGAELASQQVKKLGPTSLQEFNEQIDYAASDAVTKFGIIGVKVWMCFHKEISQKG
jgi:hypothetical protein